MAVKRYLPDGACMKEIDRYSIEEKKIPALVLMERAALAVCDVLSDNCTNGERIVFVCSVGNNGADGLAAARIMFLRGYSVAICIIGNMERATKEFGVQLNICEQLSISVVNMTCISEYDIIVDALFGIGLKRNLEGDFAKVVQLINSSGRKIVAVDMPTGISPMDGSVMGCAVRADHTVTFGFEKIGLVLYPGALYAGEVHVMDDVGFVTDRIEKSNCAWTFDCMDYKRILPKRMRDSNKGSCGKVLVIAGSKNMAGAAFFSAGAAYRSGTGLVNIMTDSVNRDVIMSLLPEAVMSFYDSITEDELLRQVLWADVIVAGPGLSMEGRAEWIVETILKRDDIKKEKVMIFDADALNIVAERGWQTMLKDVVITPHMGEMARLTGKAITSLKADALNEAKKFAAEYGCICVLKDARTIVSDGNECFVNTTGNDGMATGGSGDVLTGIVAGIIAQNAREHKDMPYFDNVCLGVYLHGMAGDFAAKKHGRHSMTARDIMTEIENTFI